MRTFVVLAMLVTLSGPAAQGVEFLGVELCAGSVDTSVVLPVGSKLTLESSEIGRHGGLLLLLTSSEGDVMDHINALMTEATGARGTGDATKQQWVGNSITAYAQLIKEGYAALAVSTRDPCDEGSEAAGDAARGAPAPRQAAPAPAAPDTAGGPGPAGAAVPASAAAAVAGEEESGPPPADPAPAAVTAQPADEEYLLKGRLKHAAAADGWVDVMGVVVNRSGESSTEASFDLSLWNAAGELICVDTISIHQLRAGQERAFRTAIRCPDYDPGQVTSWKLQFAGRR